MNMPKKIRVGAHDYSIAFPYEWREVEGVTGMCCKLTKEIRISQKEPGGKDIKSHEVIVTLIHEVLHAVEHSIGSSLFCENEGFLDGISQGICQVLRDNKDELLKLYEEGF